MDKKKKDEPISKLEKEFRDFQKQWRKFLENDFHHLVVNVDTLVKQSGGMQQTMTEMERNIVIVQNCMRAIDENIIALMKREPK